MSTLIVPISDLLRKTSDVLKTVSGGQVVYITQHGRPAAVLVDYDHYEALLAQLEDLSDLASLEAAADEPVRPYDEFLAKDLGFWFGQDSGQTRMASIEAELERICDLGCTRVNEIIAGASSGKPVPELAGLNAVDSQEVLDRLKGILAIYAAREN